MTNVPVVTIDGPSGSGKGTLSRLLAGALGWHFLDSGALYRLVALAAMRDGVPLEDAPRMGDLAASLDVDFVAGSGGTQVVLCGEDVSLAIREESCGIAASKVAVLPEVREGLLARQRAFRRKPGLVADGRDMGTVVFPDAPLKVFLTASLEERATRRRKQLKEQGIDANLHALLHDLAERDARDAQRAVAPLRPADDAMMLDSSGMDIQTVLDQVLEFVSARHLVV